MTADTPTETDIAAVAGTEDAEGVIQPTVDEILDADPEHGEVDAEDVDDDEAEA